jgi:hypothetical protein
MARTSNNKIKIGVHWKNSVSIGISSPNSPRHPKLIELDSVCILLLYFQSNSYFYRTFHSMIIFQKYVMSMINALFRSFIFFLTGGKFLNQI